MADPRGRGFKRGTGKWHKQEPRTVIVSPADFGWQYIGENEQGRIVWERESKQLCYILEREGFAVVDAETGAGDVYPGWTVEQVTGEVFDTIPFMGEPVAVEEYTMQDFYGVSR